MWIFRLIKNERSLFQAKFRELIRILTIMTKTLFELSWRLTFTIPHIKGITVGDSNSLSEDRVVTAVAIAS